MKLSRLLCAFVLFAAPVIAWAELSIQITQGVDDPIPIAVVPFRTEGLAFGAADVAEIVANDLEQVGEFTALGRENLLSMPSGEGEVFFRDWQVLAQDYLLVGQVSASPGSQLVRVQYGIFRCQPGVAARGRSTQRQHFATARHRP